MSERIRNLVARGICPDCGRAFTRMVDQQVLAYCRNCAAAFSIEQLKYEPTQREKPNGVPA